MNICKIIFNNITIYKYRIFIIEYNKKINKISVILNK